MDKVAELTGYIVKYRTVKCRGIETEKYSGKLKIQSV